MCCSALVEESLAASLNIPSHHKEYSLHGSSPLEIKDLRIPMREVFGLLRDGWWVSKSEPYSRD